MGGENGLTEARMCKPCGSDVAHAERLEASGRRATDGHELQGTCA